MTQRPIVHFLSCEGPWGDATAALMLARSQRDLGYDARLVIGASPDAHVLVDRAGVEQVPVALLDRLPLFSNGSGVKRLLTFRSEIGRYRPGVIHMHERGLFSRSADIIGARLISGCARVLTVQHPYPWPDNMAETQKKWRRASALLDQVICPSSYSLEEQLKAGLPGGRLIVLPNNVDIAKIQKGDPLKLRQELGLTEEHTIILFLARLDMQKRPLDALQAFRTVADEFPLARLVVAGMGVLSEECIQYAQEAELSQRTFLLGYRADAPDLMQAADIYILPTTCESFGNTLIEAAAAGTALITTRIAPLVGEVVPEDCGIFIPVGDIAGFAQAMRQLLADPALRQRMAEKARCDVMTRFDRRTVAQSHVDLYNRHLCRKGLAPITV